MEKNTNKHLQKESSNTSDLIRMQTEVGLFESMLRSKGLTVMVVVGILIFAIFFYSLFKIAGA